jgi:hypothetical protein
MKIKRKTSKKANKSMKTMQPKAVIPTSRTFIKVCDLYEQLYPAINRSDILAAANLFNHLVKHRGVSQGTKRFKDYRVYTIKWILGLNPDPIPCASTHKDGFLRELRFLKERGLAKPEYIQEVYTIMNVSRLANAASRKVDYSTILRHPPRGPKYHKVISDFDSYIAESGVLRKRSPEDLRRYVKPYISTKSGPNSGKLKRLNATYSCSEDAKAIINDSYLLESITEMWGFMGMDSDALKDYIYDVSKGATLEKPVHSRIACISTPENKQRVVAIVDYFSQMVLKPLESDLFAVTSQFEWSCPMDQDYGRGKVKC